MSVRLLTADPERAKSWSRAIEGLVCGSPGEAGRAQIVVTDGSLDEERSGPLVIGVGVPDGDVILPATVDAAQLRSVVVLALEALRLREESSRDPLTNLPNRRAYAEELRRRLQRPKAGDAVSALVLLDLDDFKRVNDERGLAAGDAALVAAAAALLAALDGDDFVARIGGDEFAVLTRVSTATGLEARVKELLGRFVAELKRFDPALAATAGAVPLNGTSTPETLLAQADADLRATRRRKKQDGLGAG